MHSIVVANRPSGGEAAPRENFKAGTHPYPTGIDHAYGDGPADPLPLGEVGDWVRWRGYWGNGERAIGQRIGPRPLQPHAPRRQWEHPATSHASAKWRLPRVLPGRLLHLAGRITYPKPPILRASMDGERRCRIEWELKQSPWRRSRHLYLTVHDSTAGSRAARSANHPERATRPVEYHRPRPEG
jgi:hypothetical protein